MKQHQASAQETLALLRTIGGAATLSAALASVIDTLLSPRGVRSAAALVRSGAELRVAAATGAAAPLASSSPLRMEGLLAAALSGKVDVVPLADGSTLIPGAGEAAALLLRSAEGEAFGAIVAEGSAERLADVAEALRDAGPALHRLAELEALRQAHAALEGRMALFSAICDALPDAVLVSDARGVLVVENRRARELFRAGEAAGEMAARFVQANNLIYSAFLARSADPGGPAGAVTLVEPTTGEEAIFEVVSIPVPEDGLLVSLLRDVTALKRASTALEHQVRRVRQAEVRSRRERDRLDLILKNVGAPILVTDDRDEVILKNREAERLFDAPEGAGADSAALLGVRANDGRFTRFIADFGGSAELARVAALSLTDPETGADFPAQVVSGKIMNERGQTTAVVSVFHDLTREVENERLAGELARANEGLEERVRAATAELEARNRQLEWQRRELERAYRLKSEFLASMSHELRTPINALLGYTSLMRERIYGELTARQEESLDRMYGASQHLLELVNDILDLAKIEAGRMPVHVEPVEMADVARELSEAMEPLVRRKGLEYVAEVPDGLPRMETDRTKVKQVLLNLLSNAVKFTHEGRITLRVRPAEGGGALEVSVEDTGIGIPPEHLETIWEDFRQVDQSSTREYGGTGLGLSIVRKLLALLGGSVRVESRLGEGSTFTATFPLRSRPLPEGEEAARVANAIPDGPGEGE